MLCSDYYFTVDDDNNMRSKVKMMRSSAVYFDIKNLYLSRSKLKQSSQVSALLSGFALVAMVEMDVKTEGDNKVPFALLLTFIIVTTLLVSVHMLALMISTCILPHIDAVANMGDSGGDGSGNGWAPAYEESPHRKMRHYTSIAWFFSTVIGIFLFLLELTIIVWIKFWYLYGGWVAIVSTILLIPVIGAFLFFAYNFYHKLVNYKFQRTELVLKELEQLAQQLDTNTTDDNNDNYNNSNHSKTIAIGSQLMTV
ncbi:calcium release-activated calcium channel protein 1-like [Oppia nitens]|uniref:calcium release-activated calcium channel protein 1-like n=1 Tax=Oppia nitens TaxID=1686743 RepID=UPI0023DB7A98|nr:calcium release-activated calcium channel protein 1-like [Oppia nitens]